MEKVFQAKICRLNMIHQNASSFTYCKEEEKESRYVIRQENNFVDVATSEVYESLVGTNIITTNRDLNDKKFVSDIKELDQDLVNKQILTIYLQAIQIKRLCEERKIAERGRQKTLK